MFTKNACTFLHKYCSDKIIRSTSTLVKSKANSTLIKSTEYSDSNDLDYVDNKLPPIESSLNTNREDLSHVAPYIKPTFNFASYVNKSPLLGELLKLGVNLHKLEKKVNVPNYILSLNFEDIKNHITFLHDTGVQIDDIGKLITKNPYIFRENLSDLEVRVNYLYSKKFSNDMIVRILSVNPHWLMFSTQKIDERLGFFQREFSLSGNEVRSLTIKQPNIITYSMQHLKTNMFVIKEEMGFTDEERKQILLGKPKLFMKDQNKILESFEYVHKVMEIPLEMISQIPEILTCRAFRIKQRHMFLQTLGKAKFNPKEPGYISPITMVSGSDADFCINVVKCSVESFNMFLKTM